MENYPTVFPCHSVSVNGEVIAVFDEYGWKIGENRGYSAEDVEFVLRNYFPATKARNLPRQIQRDMRNRFDWARADHLKAASAPDLRTYREPRD